MSLTVAYPNAKQEYSDDYKRGYLFKPLVRVLGFTAAQSVITYVCVTTGTPKAELLSNYETFSKLIVQVYGDAGQTQVLDKILA